MREKGKRILRHAMELGVHYHVKRHRSIQSEMIDTPPYTSQHQFFCSPSASISVSFLVLLYRLPSSKSTCLYCCSRLRAILNILLNIPLISFSVSSSLCPNPSLLLVILIFTPIFFSQSHAEMFPCYFCVSNSSLCIISL